nr:gastric triacylglycerol lipase [Odocoileus virginianus texanus]
MWWLLVTMCFIHISGNAFCFFGKIAENPEASMNVSQMISYWGYPSEMHKVITSDGYILQVYRIPHGKNDANRLGQRPVVFLQHGLLGSATNWISNLPHNSLGFLLADAGYDVWLGNSRGNTWAQEHLYYSPDSSGFWAFSFDEMAENDLPSTIDFILRRTGQEKLHYVGHSQGTTIGFIAFSTNPTLAEKIKVFYALAPVATVKYTQSLFNKLALIPHFLFKLTPPIYDLTVMNVPIAVWNGGKDLLADTQDVDLLLSKLSNLIYHKEIPNYNHLDLIWATDAP